MYRTASLLRPARCYAPAPLFSGEITVKGYFTSITRPPPPRGPLEPVCRTAVLHVYACCKCRRVVFVYQACRKYLENWSWPFSLISDGFLRPSSCRRGRWAESGCETTCYVLQHVRGQQLFHPSVLPWHVDRRSSRLLPHYRVREFVEGGGGGLTVRRKRKSSLLRPPPLFFLKVGRKRGGRNSGAVRYKQMHEQFQHTHCVQVYTHVYLRACMCMYMYMYTVI